MNVILIDSVDGDAGGDKSKHSPPEQECLIRRDARATPRLGCGARPKSAADDPLLESWQKLLAKYRKK
jgi:hypothetical protein